VENRQKTGYDRMLPGSGLLIWHIDDSMSSNSDENHFKVALVQADGLKNLENGDNRGDAGDSYPGTTNNTSFNASSTPNSKSYAGVDTCVAVNNIGASGPVMTAELLVQCKTKEGKEFWKEYKDNKERFKEFFKEFKDRKDQLKEKDFIDKRFDKPSETGMEKTAPEGQVRPGLRLVHQSRPETR
jgi:immune inhibitor A